MPTAVLHVTGARPNFPKLAPVQAALAERGVAQRIVHTGQHYDDRMSDIFFRELDLPRRAGFTGREARVSDAAKSRGAHDVARLAKVRVIEEVEKFCSELHAHFLT